MKKTMSTCSLAMVITISTTVWAFSKNLSGHWLTSKGARVNVSHNPEIGTAKFSFATTSGDNVDFKGRIKGDDGSTEFSFDGTGEDVVIRTEYGICTRSHFEIGLRGQVIGQAPKRSLEMAGCLMTYRLTCKDNDGKEVVNRLVLNDDCGGTWK